MLQSEEMLVPGPEGLAAQGAASVEDDDNESTCSQATGRRCRGWGDRGCRAGLSVPLTAGCSSCLQVR